MVGHGELTAQARAEAMAKRVREQGPLFYPKHLQEGLAPHKPTILYLIMSQQADLFMPIASV